MTNSGKMQVRCALQVARPVNEVFEAVIDPEKMKNYWIDYSTGRIETGKTITWGFPEFEIKFPVEIKSVEKDKAITWLWKTEEKSFKVKILFSEYKDDTVVTVVEEPVDESDPGIEWLKGNTEGWANFLASLKAYAEYKINLRKRAFDFRRAEIAGNQ